MRSKENLVKPIERTAQTTTTNDPIYRALEISTSKSGVYNLKKSDLKNGFYFEYYGVKVPISAVIDTNAKTSGILGIFFGNANTCPSRARGLCQLPNDSMCYALQGQKQATKKNNEDGSRGMDSTLKGLLASYYWDLFESDTQTRKTFIKYCDHYNIDTLRFNLRGDFRHSLDISAIYYLATCGLHLTGYTARDDLAELLEKLGSHPNIILNGSNRMYTNRFKVTDNIAEYMTAKNKCLGSCSACGNCYRLRGEVITVLIHGNGSETALNTAENVETVGDILYNMGIETTEEDFETAQGLVTCINHIFKSLDGNFDGFKTTKDFLNWSKHPQFILNNVFGDYYTADNVEADRGIFSAPTLEELKNLIIGSHGDLNKIVYVLGDY